MVPAYTQVLLLVTVLSYLQYVPSLPAPVLTGSSPLLLPVKRWQMSVTPAVQVFEIVAVSITFIHPYQHHHPSSISFQRETTHLRS